MGTNEIVGHERQRLEELLRNRGMQPGSYPPFTIAVKGQQVKVQQLFIFILLSKLFLLSGIGRFASFQYLQRRLIPF